jgi:dynamin 1-like protein
MIRNLVEIELGYINTLHPDFVSGMDLISTNKEEIIQEKRRLPPDNLIP